MVAFTVAGARLTGIASVGIRGAESVSVDWSEESPAPRVASDGNLLCVMNRASAVVATMNLRSPRRPSSVTSEVLSGSARADLTGYRQRPVTLTVR
jgi:hypothetical protein